MGRIGNEAWYPGYSVIAEGCSAPVYFPSAYFEGSRVICAPAVVVARFGASPVNFKHAHLGRHCMASKKKVQSKRRSKALSYTDDKGRVRWRRNDEVAAVVKQLGEYLIIGGYPVSYTHLTLPTILLV